MFRPRFRKLKLRSVRRIPRRRSFLNSKRRMFTRRRRFPTTKRGVLNVVTKKKMDTMTTAEVNPDTSVVTPGEITLDSTNGFQYFVWGPTFRSFNVNNKPNNNSQRTATETFAVGLKERMSLRATAGVSWTWRRICFTLRDISVWYNPELTVETPPFAVGVGANGTLRAFVNYGNQGSTTPNTVQMRERLFDTLFRGTQGVDWTKAINAPTNARAVKVYYDKVRLFKSGNENAVLHTVSRWHPMKKRLVYDDAEAGNLEIGRAFSAPGQGMGDYIVFDIFEPAEALDGANLHIVADATYYWHER